MGQREYLDTSEKKSKPDESLSMRINSHLINARNHRKSERKLLTVLLLVGICE